MSLSWTWSCSVQPTPQYGTDRVGDGLLRLVPRAGLPHVVLRLEHQRAGRTDADAVAAVDARGVRQRTIRFGRDVRVESAAGDRDGERVLRVGAARLDAFVAEHALRVVAHVEIVVDLHRLRRRWRRRGARAPRRTRACGASDPWTRATSPPTIPTARERACGCAGRDRCSCERPCRLRPCASTPARARARPRARRRRDGRRSPASASSAWHSVGVSMPCALQACRIVVPSGACVVRPSMVS